MRPFARVAAAGSTEQGRRIYLPRLLAVRDRSGAAGGRGASFPSRSLLFVLTALALGGAALFGAVADAAPPAVVMGGVTDVGYTTVAANGEVNPGGEPVEYSYEVSSDGGATWARQGPSAFSTASTPQSFQVTITDLTPETTYEIRLTAHNYNDETDTSSTGPNPSFTTLGPVAEPTPTLDPVTIFTNRTAHFSGTIDPGAAHTDPAFKVRWHFVCEPACSSLSNEAGEFDDDGSPHQIQTDAVVIPNQSYAIKLVAENVGGANTAQTTFHTLAPAPAAETIPAFPLTGGTKALVGGVVNPENSATVYWVEYGPTATYGTSVPAAQDESAGSGGEGVYAVQQLTGLTPSTTYHFRVMAKSAIGTTEGKDMTFTTTPESVEGSVGSLNLPDNRVWEMVSPVEKNNADIWKIAAVASPSGNEINYKSQGSFAGLPTARAGLVADYVARRGGSSWSSQGITPAGGAFLTNTGYYAFSEDLGVGVVRWNEFPDKSLDPEIENPNQGPGEHVNTYLHYEATNRYKRVNGFAGASGDFSHVVVQTPEALTQNSPCDGVTGKCVYELVNGAYRLASVLPGEVPAEGQAIGPEARFEQGPSSISQDGSRIYFTSEGGIWVRVNGSSTLPVATSERTLPPVVPGGQSEVVAVESPDGERALIKSTAELTDEDEDGSEDLYLWDSSKPEGERLTLITQGVGGINAEFSGRVGQSNDLRRVYFTASNQLVPGAPDEPGPKLFVWTAGAGAGTVEYVAAASPVGNSPFPEGTQPLARLSPDGRYLAFESNLRLTAYDNDGLQEVYLYDTDARRLVCVSCDQNGATPAGAASFNTISATEASFIPPQPLRNVSSSGQVFFQTIDPLNARDSNGQTDVYEYENGVQRLISSGTSPKEARFMDASANGDDVFFVTVDRLVKWDVDGNFDLYDARVNGGLPEPPPGVIGCEGDACQPAPTPPIDPTPASSSYNGPGNVVTPKKHPKKKQHKKHSKKKQHHKKKHQQKRVGRTNHKKGS